MRCADTESYIFEDETCTRKKPGFLTFSDNKSTFLITLEMLLITLDIVQNDWNTESTSRVTMNMNGA